MAHIFVTGADGQLARALREVTGGWDFLSKADLDITSRGEVEDFFARTQPDVVINCAAFTDVDRAETEREAAVAVNCDGVRNLAQAAAKSRAAVIHISTDYVFGGDTMRPYIETDTPAPVNFYGHSKLAGERAFFESGCRGAVVRTSWLWSDDGTGFVAAIRRKAAREGEIRVVADQVGTPTEAHSLARGLVRMVGEGFGIVNLLANSEAGLFHFCDGPVMSRAEWARRIVADAGLDCRVAEVSSTEFPTPARRPAFSALDNSKYRGMYGE